MRGLSALLACVTCVALVAGLRRGNGSRYGFYRSMGHRNAWPWSPESDMFSRRVFGGEAAELSSFPAACALLDRYWTARCSAAVVAPRWALTAAHCVSPHVAFVKYNARRPSSPDGDVATVQYLYRHPSYKVVQEDEGRGMDVTLLHHDVGLVRTRADMHLTTKLDTDPLIAMRLYNPVDMKNEEVEVLGYGRTERSMLGEELFHVKLNLVFCERGTWFHCVCGVAGGRDSRGVCSGDSGGPVLYRGVQVGVTSMGPLECARSGGSADTVVGAALEPAQGATSVFTALYNYADVINATIYDTDKALRMRRISGAPRPRLATVSLALSSLLIVMPAR